jgi:hypothetical protein
MPPERRRLGVLLSILALVALIAVARYWPSSQDGARVPGRAPVVRGGSGAASPAAISAPDVRLHALDAEPPTPDEDTQRDLFRFQTRRAPPASVAPRPSGGTAGVTRPAPPSVPSLPPIAMRYIGLVEAPEQSQKIAILSDGRGIYQGREGDIIEGRYRILRIGGESLDMAYLDGRGRQTIRLSGS